MKIDLDQFSEQGYLVLRQVIPPDQLDELRASYERLVDRQTLFCAPARHSRQAGSSKRLSAYGERWRSVPRDWMIKAVEGLVPAQWQGIGCDVTKLSVPPPVTLESYSILRKPT